MPADVLHLVVRLGADRYAIDAAEIIEVIALVRLKALAGAPAGVAGVMNYRDAAIPVIDLALVSLGTPTAALVGTRIVIARAAVEGVAGEHLIGLLVPEATETSRFALSDFESPGMAVDGTPHLGPVIATDAGIVQRVRVSALLTPAIRDAISRAHEAA